MTDYSFNPPYSSLYYSTQFEAFFGENGHTANKKLVMATSKLDYSFLYNISTSKPVGVDFALEFFEENYIHYVRNSLENEGFSTTDGELLRLSNTEDLSKIKSDNSGINKVSAITAGLIEAHRKVISAIKNERALDDAFLCDINKSVAYNSLNEASGHFRGEFRPELSTSVFLGINNGFFIPILPEYGVMNLRKLWCEEYREILKDADFIQPLAVESFTTYQQLFPDGNTRTANFFAYALSIKNGYIPFVHLRSDLSEYALTKNKLLMFADPKPRFELLGKRFFEANTRWCKKGEVQDD